MGTLVVNLLGMFFVGLFSVWFVEKNLVQTPYREMVLVGFLGGLTTFSTFGNESYSLLHQNKYPELFFYLGGNLLLGFALLLFGRNLGTR
jgi:CrcB protein